MSVYARFCSFAVSRLSKNFLRNLILVNFPKCVVTGSLAVVYVCLYTRASCSFAVSRLSKNFLCNALVPGSCPFGAYAFQSPVRLRSPLPEIIARIYGQIRAYTFGVAKSNLSRSFHPVSIHFFDNY
jgi:hypothetical protein